VTSFRRPADGLLALLRGSQPATCYLHK
jgi:hypothetical protein